MKIRILLFFVISCRLACAQGNWALGAGGVYDFQTNGIGVGVRAFIPITQNIAVSPQVHYFFPFNTIHELYGGLAVQYSLFPERNWTIYPLMAAYYNRWLNSSDFTGKVAKPDNIAEEAGIGLMKNSGCIRPFIEGRYDFKWKEFDLHAGLLFYFGDCFSMSPDRCPAYN
jgi:hypothetical protein